MKCVNVMHRGQMCIKWFIEHVNKLHGVKSFMTYNYD